MGWRAAAEFVLVIHFAFVVFIVVGAALIRWIPAIAPLHLASLAYGIAIQSIGFTCPLTPLEKSLRTAGGGEAYEGGFIGHYIIPILYPGEFTPMAKIGLVAAVAVINVGLYVWVSAHFLKRGPGEEQRLLPH